MDVEYRGPKPRVFEGVSIKGGGHGVRVDKLDDVWCQRGSEKTGGFKRERGARALTGKGGKICKLKPKLFLPGHGIKKGFFLAAESRVLKKNGFGENLGPQVFLKNPVNPETPPFLEASNIEVLNPLFFEGVSIKGWHIGRLGE